MCVGVCVRARARACVCESVCVRACVCAFMLYALNFDNMYLYRTCKHLGPVRVRRSKYSLLLLSLYGYCWGVGGGGHTGSKRLYMESGRTPTHTPTPPHTLSDTVSTFFFSDPKCCPQLLRFSVLASNGYSQDPLAKSLDTESSFCNIRVYRRYAATVPVYRSTKTSPFTGVPGSSA